MPLTEAEELELLELELLEAQAATSPQDDASPLSRPGGYWGLGAPARALAGQPEGYDWQTGVQDAGIRARLSLADSDQEAMTRAEEIFGPGTVTRDPTGRLAVSSAGMEAAGLPPSASGEPTLVDERGASWYDLADVAGSIPEFLGAAGGGMAASGMGFVPGIAISGAGGLLGKAAGESGEYLAGENRQSLGDVMSDIGAAGAWGAGGEAGYRSVLAPVGRALMAPGAGPAHWFTGAPHIDPQRARLATQAREMGGHPTVSQVTQHPVIGRVQEAAELFLGQPTSRANAAVLQNEMKRLEGQFGSRRVTAGEAGEAVKNAVYAGREAMGDWAQRQAKALDDMTGGDRVIPTAGFKRKLTDLLGELPREQRTVKKGTGVLDAQGNEITHDVVELGAPIGIPQETLSEINKFRKIQDHVTLSEWQRMRTDLRDGISTNTLMPGVSSRDAKRMVSAVDGMLDDAVAEGNVNQGLARAAKKFRDEYREKAEQYSAYAIERIARKSQYRGALDPEDVVRTVIEPGNATQTKRIMNLLPGETRDKVRQITMREIMQDVSRTNPKNITEQVFAGASFKDALERNWSTESLEAVFGSEHAKALQKFAETQAFLVEKQPMIGGLAVANVALHPWDNLPQQTQWRLWQKMLFNRPMLAWFTEGVKAPNTRRGAAAITRLNAQAQTMLDDMTQAFTLPLGGEEDLLPSSAPAPNIPPPEAELLSGS